jgi:hypothetical protein
MAIVADIRLEGLKEIEARMVELDAMAGSRLLTRAVRRSLIPLEKRATANVRRFSESGALEQSIKIVTVRPRGSEVVAAQVGPKKTDRRALALHNVFYGRRRRGIFYGHLVEFGFTTRGINSRRVKGWSWFGAAWSMTRAGVLPEFQRILAVGMRRIERRAKRKNAEKERTVDP